MQNNEKLKFTQNKLHFIMLQALIHNAPKSSGIFCKEFVRSPTKSLEKLDKLHKKHCLYLQPRAKYLNVTKSA